MRLTIEKPTAVQHIYALAKRSPELNLVPKLQRFLAGKETQNNSIICDAAARILSVIISDHERYTDYIEDCKIFIGMILSDSV